jgi:iron-sulfur cluster repair protein YtfE (RIC family)
LARATHAVAKCNASVAKTHMRINPKATINSITHEYPDTIVIFSDYGIDSCCGGEKALDEVARRHGLPLNDIVTRLESVAAAGDPQR